MAQVLISVKVDPDDKEAFEAFCKQTGMNISVAINMFIKTVIREKRIPFEVKVEKIEYEQLEVSESDSM